ncbi:MAG: hypothetical protein ACK57T_19235, partial [Dolichospermum sp.]
LVYILKAPKLNRPQEWMTEIPDFGIVSDHKSKIVVNSQPKKSQPKSVEPEYIDLSTVNTKDNRFVWVALIAVCLTIFYLVWLSF